MSFFKHTYETAKKELTHVLRDRRTVLSTQIFTLMGPVLLIATVSALAGDAERSPRVGVVGADAAPELTTALSESGIVIEAIDRAPRVADDMGDFDAVLVVPDDYQGERTAKHTARLQIFRLDGADAKRAESQVTSVLQRKATEIADAELLRRGMATAIVRPIGITTIDISKSGRASVFAIILVMYLAFAPLLASAGAAVDTATGERTRGTLALMRLQPISPLAWVTGKWLTVVAFAWAGTIATTVLSAVAVVQVVPSVASTLNLTPASVAVICVASLPLALIAGALNFVLALQARSTMEAQTRLSLVALLPAAVGLWATAGGAPVGLPIPMVHEIVGLSEWLSGRPFPATAAAINAVFALVVVAVALVWARRRIASEAFLASV